MKIKATWGFIGDPVKLKSNDARVRAGQTFDGVDDEYAHQLIGRGLAEAVGAAPDTKPAAPRITKPAAPKETK